MTTTRLSALFTALRTFVAKIGGYAVAHKILTGVVLVVLGGLGYWGYTTYVAHTTPAQYVLATAVTEPIQVSVSGSGQVSSQHAIALSPKNSGNITYIGVTAGQQVTAGTIVAEVDSTDAQKAVRDARTNLQSAQITYAQALASSDSTLQKTRDDAFVTIANTMTDLGTTMTGLDDILHGTDLSYTKVRNNSNAYVALVPSADVVAAQTQAERSYVAAYTTYQTTRAAFQQVEPNTDPATFAALLSDTYTSAQRVAAATKDAHDFLDLVNTKITNGNQTVPSVLPAQRSSLNNYQNTIGNDVSNVLSAKVSFDNARQSLSANSEPLAVLSARLALTKAQNALTDAQDTLEDYIVRAPFSGTIADVNVQKFDQVSASTNVATLITDEQYVLLSLNEIDAAHVKIGQPVSVTFDAITGLTIPGSVAEMNGVGVVTQGVVTYDVKIGFAKQDARVKPGMTANVTIVTASKDAALVVPSSAVKTQNGRSYVEVAEGVTNAMQTVPASRTTASSSPIRSFSRNQTVDANTVTLRRVPVETGIISDTMTEITSGLAEGDRVVTQTITVAGATAAPSAPSLFGPSSGRQSGNFGGSRPANTGAGAGK